MKNLFKVILTLVILTVMFIKAYVPLMNESDSSTLNTKAADSYNSLSKIGK